MEALQLHVFWLSMAESQRAGEGQREGEGPPKPEAFGRAKVNGKAKVVLSPKLVWIFHPHSVRREARPHKTANLL